MTNEEAIKALEKEPCEDAVSRQAVEKMIKAEMPERGMWEIEGDTVKETVCEVCVDLIQELYKLQPVTPKEKTGWIPVSEGLPEERKTVSGPDTFIDPSEEVLVQMKSGFMKVSRYWGSRERYRNRPWIDLDYPTTDEVIAWMPLPERYKESERIV